MTKTPTKVKALNNPNSRKTKVITDKLTKPSVIIANMSNIPFFPKSIKYFLIESHKPRPKMKTNNIFQIIKKLTPRNMFKLNPG